MFVGFQSFCVADEVNTDGTRRPAVNSCGVFMLVANVGFATTLTVAAPLAVDVEMLVPATTELIFAEQVVVNAPAADKAVAVMLLPAVHAVGFEPP